MGSSVLYDDGKQRCIAFHDLVRGEEGVAANQFLITRNGRGCLIDPGGALLYTPLSLALSPYTRLDSVDYILASHQDPDVIGSVDRWLMYTPAIVASSRLWGRFIPHSVPHYQKNTGPERYLLIPDAGIDIPFQGSAIRAVPAHFLHSVGNFQFYDPVSRILFSGDVGASVAPQPYGAVADFEAHTQYMSGFHRRYMAGNAAIRVWLSQVRRLEIDKIVPQHGNYFEGANVARFLDWMEHLRCGVDLMAEPGQFAA